MLRNQIAIKIVLIALAVGLTGLFDAAPAEAAMKCTRLIKTVGGEQMINTCRSCRIVKIQRKRPGASAPINRTLTLAPKTTTDLSFRGPGQSRILSDAPCRPATQGASNTGQGEEAKRCILMQRTVKGGVSGLALANNCNECRTAVIDRIDAKGNRRSQNVVIAARSVIALPAKGAVQAGVLRDKPCR